MDRLRPSSLAQWRSRIASRLIPSAALMTLPPEVTSASLLDECLTPAASGEALQTEDADETFRTSIRTGEGDHSELAVESLATAYVIVTNSLAETLYKVLAHLEGGTDRRHLALRREEACVAAWTAIQTAIGCSTLSLFHRRSILHVLKERLAMYWQSRAKSTDWLDLRASKCLLGDDGRSFTAVAIRIIAALFESISLPSDEHEGHARALAGMVAHRIASDVHLLNEWELRHTMQKACPPSGRHSF